VTGTVIFPAGAERCIPGDDLVELTVRLPDGSPLPLHQGQRFVIREGGRTVGPGVVTRLLT
jgi:elongation factor Tu